MPILDIQAIRDILPHRYPMLLVDAIIELEEERIVGIKNVTVNEPYFQGHFPDFPVLPGHQLRIEMKVTKRKASVAKMHGQATVDGVVMAEAILMCKLADRAPLAESAPAEAPVPVL